MYNVCILWRMQYHVTLTLSGWFNGSEVHQQKLWWFIEVLLLYIIVMFGSILIIPYTVLFSSNHFKGIDFKVYWLCWHSYRICLVKHRSYYYLMNAASVQTRPPFNTGKQFLSHCFHNRLWASLVAVLFQGVACNLVNTLQCASVVPIIGLAIGYIGLVF